MIGWGQRLKTLRGSKTLDVWSALAQVSRSNWVDYEHERRSPNLETLLKIAQLSGHSIHWIATGELPPKGIDFDLLKDVVQAIEEEVPSIDAESKAKLILRLYNDRMLTVQKQNIGVETKNGKPTSSAA
jgi:transcriptional regulator with XRE-family HTH domain